MLKIPTKHALLLLITATAFLYRFMLMTWNTFPPGADIGLHESVLKSILVGKDGFFWNYYQMGGGVSATNPGYHIFVASVTAMTGVPDYLAHALVASFFSAFIVLAAFLFVRSAWNESASFVAAFLVAFSGGDIAILVWGGYPNIITLMLIPLVFFLFLQRSKFSQINYFTLTSLMVAAMFLTHLFSAFVFATITGVTQLILAVFPRKVGLSKIRFASVGLLPIVFGALLVSPYLFQAVPTYFGSEGAITDTASKMKQALLETRLISPNVVYLSLIPVFLFFLLSKVYKGKFVTIHSVLSSIWILVPALLTQSYLLGIYLDYERFMYFLFLPVIIAVALLIVLGVNYLSRILDWVRNKIRGTPHGSSSKIVIPVFILGILLFSVFFIPLFAAPNFGFAEAKSYQAMTNPGYEALQWIKTNTPPGSVCVADAYFGWWLSGFAERPTLSAVDPQYLILAHEFEPARVAGNLLDTNYFIENGFLRVKQNSQSVDSAPEFSAWLNDSYVPYSFFSLNNSEINFIYRNNGVPQHFSFAEVHTANMQVENHGDYAAFMLTVENQLFNYTEEITLYRGISFAKISITLQTDMEGVNFDWLHLPFQQKGVPTQYGDTIAGIDRAAQVISQIIFPENKLDTNVFLRENPESHELVYALEGKNTVQVQFFAGLTQYPYYPKDYEAINLQDLIANNTKTFLYRKSHQPISFFDYKATIKEWNVSYIIIRNVESVPRLAKDPFFRLVFKNNEVAIFKAKK